MKKKLNSRPLHKVEKMCAIYEASDAKLVATIATPISKGGILMFEGQPIGLWILMAGVKADEAPYVDFCRIDREEWCRKHLDVPFEEVLPLDVCIACADIMESHGWV